MAKDSDKISVLIRRTLELRHSINHEFNSDAIARRAEKVRRAAISVAKKSRGPFAHLTNCPGNQDWENLKQRWEQLTTDEIIEIVHQWPEQPRIKDVQLLSNERN